MGSEVSEVLKELKNDKFGVWIFRILCLAIIVVIGRHFYKDFQGEHSNLFWGLHEVNNAKNTFVHDTVYEYKHDTVVIRQGILKQPKQLAKNEQKIDSGGSGIQNNAPNYGNQAGRDLTVVSEKTLTTQEINDIVNYVQYLREKNKIQSTEITLLKAVGSNGAKIYNQIRTALIDNGYKIFPGMQFNAVNKIEIGVSDNQILINVGTFK